MVFPTPSAFVFVDHCCCECPSTKYPTDWSCPHLPVSLIQLLISLAFSFTSHNSFLLSSKQLHFVPGIEHSNIYIFAFNHKSEINYSIPCMKDVAFSCLRFNYLYTDGRKKY
uniref:Uncharacterized protein n=1 Tax=Micrurus spixii TaxID=129469 RepID=A0A2D4LA63_9SAUR